MVIVGAQWNGSATAAAVNGWNVVVSDSPGVGVGTGADGEFLFEANNSVKGVPISGQGATNVYSPHVCFLVIPTVGKYIKGVTINFAAAHTVVINLLCRELIGDIPGALTTIAPRVAPVVSRPVSAAPRVSATAGGFGTYQGFVSSAVLKSIINRVTAAGGTVLYSDATATPGISAIRYVGPQLPGFS